MTVLAQDSFRSSPLFKSYFLGGFECSTHRRPDGRRLDLLAATAHDCLVQDDYRLLETHGIRAARDGLRWHRIETSPGQYDWSGTLPMLQAAEDSSAQIIWDLCHYGWPDDIDIWSPQFIDRFARFAAEAARIITSESDRVPFFCPVNEISFWAWAGGDAGRFNPSCLGRGPELKRQLVRAAIAAIEAIWTIRPDARFITAEPLINVDPGGNDPERSHAAEIYRLSQFEALDMLCGTLEPDLGGNPSYLDVIGVNYYPDNQWYHHGPTIPLGHHAYRPFHQMLAEVSARYRRPILIAETGAEGSARSAWLHYVCSEVAEALEHGVPVEGICLYPILDYPGWDNSRSCQVGLFSAPDPLGRRAVCSSMARELKRQQPIFESLRSASSPTTAVLKAVA